MEKRVQTLVEGWSLSVRPQTYFGVKSKTQGFEALTLLKKITFGIKKSSKTKGLLKFVFLC